MIAEYTPATHDESPAGQTELSATGQKAFKQGFEYYKILVEQYKNNRHELEKEQASAQHIVAFIQPTIPRQLLRIRCLTDNTP